MIFIRRAQLTQGKNLKIDSLATTFTTAESGLEFRGVEGTHVK